MFKPINSGDLKGNGGGWYAVKDKDGKIIAFTSAIEGAKAVSNGALPIHSADIEGRITWSGRSGLIVDVSEGTMS
jgi:hypothetical protein